MYCNEGIISLMLVIYFVLIIISCQYKPIISYFTKAMKIIGNKNILKVKNPINTTMKSTFSLTREKETNYCNNNTYVFGIDEAGRGPLAGPVVTAACFIVNDVDIPGICDSKQTKEHDREATYNILVNHPSVLWTVSVVSHIEIDEVNILQATMNGMRRSAEELLPKLKILLPNHNFLALIDGNHIPENMPVPSQYVIKGDSIIFSIAAASIIAKVTRDRIMIELDKQYPLYNLAQHKGYPTYEHRTLLLKHGPSPIHRKSYAPVKRAMELFEDENPGALNEQRASDNKLISKVTKKNKLITKDNTKLESNSKSNLLKRDNSTINNLEITELECNKTDSSNKTINNNDSNITSNIRKSLRISKRTT